jgi:predicted  nucleic acid-binding Zn-ribbon protein
VDSDLKNMITKILEGQERLETKVSEMESEVKKLSFKIEKIESQIDIIAEVQAAHKEQSSRHFEKALLGQDNTNTLVISSLKTLSDEVTEIKKDIKDLREKFDQVEKITTQNTYDVAYLKSVQ